LFPSTWHERKCEKQAKKMWFKKNKNKPNKRDLTAEVEKTPSAPPDDMQPPESEEHDLKNESEASENLNAARLQAPGEDEPTPEPPDQEAAGYFKRLKNRLSKTRKSLTGGFERIFSGKQKIDDEVLEELEELLITSDIGVPTTMALIERITKAKLSDISQLKTALKKEILSILDSRPDGPAPQIAAGTPHVVLVVGVNGVGKTTTIGKLAASAGASGKKVLIAAADTFRAAAVEQLGIWADRAKAEFVKHKENADPAAVAFDAVAAASARGCDLVLIDTAGRLHTKVNLMEELKKIKRTVAKQVDGAPHEILLVLDATTGQNALSQAKLFNDALDVTGLALTKLDGTAKGGIVIGICSALNIPLQYIGIGEQIEDLRPFDAAQFVDALF
jgi:fused signal recognition particle receptor